MSAKATSREPGALMKIGELARKTGKTNRALHLYEEMGLLSPPRSAGGFRLYGPDELARVYWISKLQDMGFKLAQIQGLLAAVRASATAPHAMTGVRELFRGKLDETRAQVERLAQLERDLAESLAYLEDCRSCEEQSAHACVSCQPERHQVPQPSLVSGLHLSRKASGGLGEGIEHSHGLPSRADHVHGRSPRGDLDGRSGSSGAPQ